MPTVTFTAALQRHVPCPPASVEATTVADALSAVFADNPLLRGYVLEDDGAVRKHIAVWVDGEPLRDRRALSDAVSPGGEVYVMQALSGG